jgi:hypothetical protein
MSDTSPQMPIVCSTWRTTLFHVVPDGIEARCKSCRGTIHHISRARIEQIWDEFKVQVEEAVIPEEKIEMP